MTQRKYVLIHENLLEAHMSIHKGRKSFTNCLIRDISLLIGLNGWGAYSDIAKIDSIAKISFESVEQLTSVNEW